RVLRPRRRGVGPWRFRQAVAARAHARRGPRVGAPGGVPRSRAGRGRPVAGGGLQRERSDALRRAGLEWRSGRHGRRARPGAGYAARVVRPLGGAAGGGGARARVPVIDAGPCIIRPWRHADRESLVRHADNRRVWLMLRDQFPHPYTRADADAWLAHVAQQQPVTSFAIVVCDEAAGGIGVAPQPDVHRRSAEIGYWLVEG